MTLRLGLSPQAVFEQFAVWQPFTYMFLHSTGGLGHMLFNMLALWMFGTELERTWGTRFFTKYYFVTGIGAGGHEPAAARCLIDGIYYSVDRRRVGRHLWAAARLWDVFPAPARSTCISSSRCRRAIFVIIAGAIAFCLRWAAPAAVWRTPRTLAAWWSGICI